MKIRLPILLTFMICFCFAKANHLIGGEITYTYLTSNKYKVNVTLYRDCNDGKLDNQGGGSSTSQGSYLTEAFIRTISSNCQNKNIGSITLTKTGFENITPVCDLNKSSCGSDPTYSYGIEAHYYTGTIDFDSYSAYNGCAFHIFIHQATRNEDITTLATEEEDLYNYVYINPWFENKSSPKFTNQPNIIFNNNQPVYSGDYVSKNADDSIVYKWSAPLKSHNSNIQYISNYSAQQFIRTYCPSGVNCTANPTSYPPQGLYLNQNTGDYAFTPITLNQTSTRVVEVEQWRKSNGTTYLASKIRRDVLVRVINENSNNSPIIQADETYNLCVGQPFKLEVTASDLNVNGTTSSDTVSFETETSLSSLNIVEKSSTDAPFNYLEFSITPTSNQVGTHTVRVKALDNHCPKYGESYKTIKLVISAKPSINWSINDLFCGNNEISIDANRNASYHLKVSDKAENIISAYTSISSGYIYQSSNANQLVYQLKYEDELGCTDSLTKEIRNIGSIGVTRARLTGDSKYCEGENLSNSLAHNIYSISNIAWIINNQDTLSRDTINTNATHGYLYYDYTLTHNNLECPLTDSSDISVVQSPEITLQGTPSFCFNNVLSIENLEPTPSGGNWFWNEQPVQSTIDISAQIPNVDTSITLTYKIDDNSNSCTAHEEFKLDIKHTPELQLSNIQICGTESPFILSNCIDKPYNPNDAFISWRMLNRHESYKETPNPLLDLPTYGEGTYRVEGVNSSTNGCSTTDTVEITVDKNLELVLNGESKLCQGSTPINLNKILGINIEGGAWTTDNSLSFVSKHEYIPNECGSKKFQYVYDRDGCYDEIDIDVQIICAPTFNLKFDDKICKDNDVISLPDGYTWNGTGVSQNKFDPSIAYVGKNSITASKSTTGCMYDTSMFVNVITPQTFEVANLPIAICEGEKINFQIESENEIFLDALFCSTQVSESSVNPITYSPTDCDLVNEQIAFTLTSTEKKYCPSHSNNYSVLYHPKPKVELPDLKDGCSPYNLNTQLTVAQGKNPDISFTIKSENTVKLGVGNTISFDNLYEGSYDIAVSTKDANGCEAIQDFNSAFNVWSTPEASFQMSNEDVLVLSKRELFLNNYSTLRSGNLASEWYYIKGSKTTLFSTKNNPVYEMPADTGMFDIMLVAKSNNNCKDTSTESVMLVPDIIIFIPNAFTPNNNPPNNLFKLSSSHAQTYEINIYNKWGQKVFNSKSLDHSWDGTYQGQFCPNGVYLYSVNLVNKSGVPYTFQGTVNLIR